MEVLDTSRLLPWKNVSMRGDQITSHDVGRDEGESLEAGEVGRTMYMADQSVLLKHKFMVCGHTRQMMLCCTGSWPVGRHSLPFILLRRFYDRVLGVVF